MIRSILFPKDTLKPCIASIWFVATAIGLAVASGTAQGQTLYAALSTELKILDPVYTTASITRNHGFMIYDQLFGIDLDGQPRPQMVETHTVRDDGLVHSFTLRDGLRFHDGQPVRATDVIASIRRWGERDSTGKLLLRVTEKLEAVAPNAFRIKLSEPFGMLRFALGKPSGSALFIMPERVANTPASEPITDMTGSGPFIFKRDEWRQGYKVVYEKNRHYIPRDEPADGLAGGKVVKVDRVEWVTIPDPNITVAALANGEVDFVESPSVDLIPVLERSPNVELYVINVRGQSGWLRPNHLAEPFDHPAARQALLYIIDQEEILRALGIPKEDAWPHCASYFICPLPVRHEHGAHLGFTPDLNKARALLEEAGYNGGPVNILQPTDILTTSQASLVIVHQLRKAGINARAVPMDWGTLVARRAKKPSEDSEPWHLFPTIATSLDAGNPLTNFYISTPCPNSIPGWPCDEKLESLRQEWIRITDPARKHLLEEHITSRARLVVPYVNWGQWQARTAYNKVLKGVQPSLVPVFWNIEKKES